MKKTLILPVFVLLFNSLRSQQLGQVTIANGSSLSYFSLVADQGVLIRISPDGKILEWGMEEMALRGNFYAPRLQPFMGRIEYYGPESDSIQRGKVRSIGTTTITYYGAYENESKIGKLRTVGTMIFDYYNNYDNTAMRGKIRNIGNLNIEYYSSFDEEILRGKLKGVGSTAITYYTGFDDKLIRGQVKTIGPFKYTWYTSLDLHAARGALKSGEYRQSIAGVVYILR